MYRLSDPRLRPVALHDLLDPPRSKRSTAACFEQVSVFGICLQVTLQYQPKAGREKDIAVFGTLALVDEDLATAKIHFGNLDLTNSLTRTAVKNKNFNMISCSTSPQSWITRKNRSDPPLPVTEAPKAREKQMKRISQAIVTLWFAVTTLAPTSALAQTANAPFDGVLKLVEWFAKLNVQFEEIVKVEKEAQLLRSVDRLRKDLYALEVDTQILKDNIPDKSPNVEQQKQLQKLIVGLQTSVDRLKSRVREIGADLRLDEEGLDEELGVESAVTYELRLRSGVLTYLEHTIYYGPWNVQEVRDRVEQDLQTVRAAQVAVTTFRHKLSSAK